MIRTASKDKGSGTAQHDETERAHGVDNELEIVLKSGGAYCFAKKLNRASDDLERPSANLEEIGPPIPPDVGEGGAENPPENGPIDTRKVPPTLCTTPS